MLNATKKQYQKPEYARINLLVTQIEKNTRVRRNPVLFKSSSIFQRFD